MLTFGVLWYRYHNYWAGIVKDQLETQFPDEHISDERIFLEARKMVVGIYQVRIQEENFPEILNTTKCILL